ncbi:RHS repeat-associated core domain-containing protein, partial [Leucobacter sp. UT-8R-CII-1-4]|uniref:RHS repeat-associated core domain-containing protein n=1 Tax=Leucobacter sp. UT-8R-CII-1-4 TaxID=3040075 RepID=UPI0024A8F7A5
GELQDAGTGVVAFGSRSYDAASGSWMAPDAWPGLLVQPQSLNRYAYVLGDPVTFVDVGGFAASVPKTVLNPSALLNHYTPSGGAGTWNSSNAFGDRALTATGQTVAAGAGGSSPNTVSQTILQDRHADAVRVCTSLPAKASCGPNPLQQAMRDTAKWTGWTALGLGVVSIVSGAIAMIVGGPTALSGLVPVAGEATVPVGGLAVMALTVISLATGELATVFGAVSVVSGCIGYSGDSLCAAQAVTGIVGLGIPGFGGAIFGVVTGLPYLVPSAAGGRN